MFVIGLTGGIAAGKSLVSDTLRELGAVVIDADRLGHRSYEPGTPGFQKVVNAFGHDIVGSDGVIDRRVLGGKVFGAPEEMQRLNDIVWPEIRTLLREELDHLRDREPDAVVVLEAAVLLEAGWQDLCDEVWVVNTTIRNAVERLQARNGLSEEAALARINSQMPARERAERADVKIENNGTEEQLQARVERAWKQLERRITTNGKQPAKAAARRR
jgi:dephospho-CoA kinase